MKNIISFLCCFVLLLLVSPVWGQVDVRVEPVRSTMLLGENVSVKVTFVNYTDAKITLDNSPEHQWLVFSVHEAGQAHDMNPLARARFPKLVLSPGSRKSFEVNLSPYFNFQRANNYQVVATVVMPDGVTTYSSRRAPFLLSAGSEVRAFRVQMRGHWMKISVRMLMLKQKTCLFGQVYDLDANRVVGACYLGQHLNFQQPSIMLDAAQNLHCLVQSTPVYFTYSVMDTHGRRSSCKIMQRSGGPVMLSGSGRGITPQGVVPYVKKPAKQEDEHNITDRPF